MKSSISSLLNLKNETTAICPITGICYLVSFPNLGIDFSFKSPFTKYENIEKIISLSSTELRKLPKVTLAGIVLAALKYNDMVTMHSIQAFEANTYLQLLPSSQLVSSLKMISIMGEYKRELLPTLSLDSLKENVEYSTRTDLLSNFLKACSDIINPPASTVIETTSISTSVKEERKAKKSILSEDKKALKEAVSTLATDSLTSQKLANILYAIQDGNTLINMDNTIRDKLISRLAIYETRLPR
jgi:hypothetical protein